MIEEGAHRAHHYQLKKLKRHLLVSLESVVGTLTDFGPPVIAILKATNMKRYHVIGIWQNQIIDFECEYTYLLTKDNLNYACGDNSSFLCLARAIALFPPQDVKRRYLKENEGNYDWISIHHQTVKDIS